MKAIGELIGLIVFWVVALMGLSLVFTPAFNHVSGKFGVPRLDVLDSLCILACLWIAGRTATRAVTISARVSKDA